MERNDVLSNLCYHDKRNPDYSSDMDGLDKTTAIGGGEICYCDNCFYGRTRMAEYILKLLEEEEDRRLDALARNEYD